MVWVVEKKVVHHMLGLGFERVDMPIRVKFEFEVKDGSFVPNSLSTQTVYNRKALETRYPGLNSTSLENAIEKKVKKEILDHLKACGFLNGEDDSGICL